MTDTSAELEEERPPPEVGVRVIYQGPVAPHWEVEGMYGDPALVAEFRRRTMARLQLLPPHDPQFGRNRARVSRDAERENFELAWDIGEPEEDGASEDGEAEADEASGGRAEASQQRAEPEEDGASEDREASGEASRQPADQPTETQQTEQE